VLPPEAGGEPHSRNRGLIAPDSDLDPHLRAMLALLEERARERRRCAPSTRRDAPARRTGDSAVSNIDPGGREPPMTLAGAAGLMP
jgi:hypothetical protein